MSDETTTKLRTSPAAVAGYPKISIPVGLTPEGKPAGIWMYASFLQEPKLIAFAYDLEQALQPRRAVPWRDSAGAARRGLCAATTAAAQTLPAAAGVRRHLGTGKPLSR